jgi:hypothetical protein
MTTLYKLTTQDFYTRKGEANACLWGENITHSGTGEGPLCGPGWIHAYEHPLLAVFFNPIHADISNPVLWECKGKIALRDNQIKVGCRSVTTLKQIPLPTVTTNQRIYFAIECALAVYPESSFGAWAEEWISGKDRTADAADAAARAAYAAAYAAAHAAHATAYAAARAAAYATAYAADAAAYAADAAAYAANAVQPLNLLAIAKQAHAWEDNAL